MYQFTQIGGDVILWEADHGNYLDYCRVWFMLNKFISSGKGIQYNALECELSNWVII